MSLKPIEQWRGGEPVSASKLNRINSRLHRRSRIRVSGAAICKDTPYGQIIHVRNQGGGVFDHPFKVSRVAVADPSDDYLTVSEGRLHFWEGDEWNIATEEITSSDSWTVSDDEGVYTAEYIYAQLKYEDPDWVWSLGHGEDNPQDPDDEETDEDDQEQRTWIIAYMDTDGSIDQRINQDIYDTMGG